MRASKKKGDTKEQLREWEERYVDGDEADQMTLTELLRERGKVTEADYLRFRIRQRDAQIQRLTDALVAVDEDLGTYGVAVTSRTWRQVKQALNEPFTETDRSGIVNKPCCPGDVALRAALLTAEIEGMKAENEIRRRNGESLAYDGSAFANLVDQWTRGRLVIPQIPEEDAA